MQITLYHSIGEGLWGSAQDKTKNQNSPLPDTHLEISNQNCPSPFMEEREKIFFFLNINNYPQWNASLFVITLILFYVYPVDKIIFFNDIIIKIKCTTQMKK